MTDEERSEYWRGAYDRMSARSIEDGARIAALEAENERLRKALKGVAGYSTMRSGDWRDEFPELYEATDRSSRSEIVSIFARHAAAALEAKP